MGQHLTKKRYDEIMRAASKAALAGYAAQHPGEKLFKFYDMAELDKYVDNLEKTNNIKVYYKMIFGERSNGKTYKCLADALYRYFAKGEQFAYVRRRDVDIKGKRGATLFDGHIANGLIYQMSGGEWDGVKYISSRFYLTKDDEDDKGRPIQIVSDDPIGYTFALNTSGHDKGGSYPLVTTVIFDEFIEPSGSAGYLVDEFVTFCNLLSTIIRLRNNVTIYMLANTVSRYGCPYFEEMGLKQIKTQKPGDICGYTYTDNDTGRTMGLVCEYIAPQSKSKPSNIYFAFNNAKLDMIKNGAWEIGCYPHIPIHVKPSMIKFRFFVQFDGETLECQLIYGAYYTEDDDGKKIKHIADFLAVVPKTTDIKDEDNQLVYTTIPDPRPTHRRNIRRPYYDIELSLVEYFRADRVYYANNDVGNLMHEYLNWCKRQII